jgi:hypothetical protein
MDEMLTNSEIESRYPGEWILIEVLENGDTFSEFKGRVLCHSPDRDAVYRKAVELKPKNSAILCTVKLPENTEIVL